MSERIHNPKPLPTMSANNIVLKIMEGIVSHKNRTPSVNIKLTNDAFVELADPLSVPRLRIVDVKIVDQGYPVAASGGAAIFVVIDMDDTGDGNSPPPASRS